MATAVSPSVTFTEPVGEIVTVWAAADATHRTRAVASRTRLSSRASRRTGRVKAKVADSPASAASRDSLPTGLRNARRIDVSFRMHAVRRLGYNPVVGRRTSVQALAGLDGRCSFDCPPERASAPEGSFVKSVDRIRPVGGVGPAGVPPGPTRRPCTYSCSTRPSSVCQRSASPRPLRTGCAVSGVDAVTGFAGRVRQAAGAATFRFVAVRRGDETLCDRTATRAGRAWGGCRAPCPARRQGGWI